MKILLLTDGIAPFVIGGMQKHSYLLTKYLARAGVKVELHHCVYDNAPLPDTKSAFLLEENQHITAFAHRFPSKGKIPGHYIRNSYQYSKTLCEAVKTRLNEFDFIYTKGFTGWELLKEKQKGFKMPRVGVKLHGMNMFLPTYGFKEKIEQFILRPPAKFVMKQADVVFSYGGKVTDTIILAGIPKSKIIEIPTGIEEKWIRDSITPSNKIRKFIFIGRYDHVKGIRELTGALRLIKGNFEFHFVGPFEENQKLLKPNIFYHGVISDTRKMKGLLDKMDILVLPSYSEGMPNVILEAMARGLVILSTDAGAVNKMVSKSNGWLMPNSSIKLLQQTIIEVLSKSPESIDLLKKHSLQFVEKTFLWSKLAKVLINKIEMKIRL